MTTISIKKTFQPFLWSYDLAKLDLKRDKKRVITNVLNFGTKKATDLLKNIYTVQDMRDAIINPLPGEWNKKSINYWSLVLNAKPGNLKRIIK